MLRALILPTIQTIAILILVRLVWLDVQSALRAAAAVLTPYT
jgi:hypothetical protein